MITALDHVVVLVSNLDTATRSYETLFARTPSWRSMQDGTATALFTLENMTLELVAAVGDGDTADKIRAAHHAQGGDGLASLCFRVDDLPKMHRRLARLALEPEPITDGSSTNTRDGATLSWQRTRAATTAAHGVRLFFLQSAQQRPKSDVSGDASNLAPIEGLDHVVVATHQPERAAALYGARLGLDMALDRSQPEWGRLMFFRCGDLIVEIVQRPGQNDPTQDDKVWGLSWRAGDLDATRTRLVAAGVEVSEIRSGRKPGTRVMSLKSGTCGVPTLLLERSAT